MRKILIALVFVFALVITSGGPFYYQEKGVGPLAGQQEYAISRYDQNRSGRAPFVSDITNPTVRWTFQTNGSIVGAPIIADINNDGINEIVFGSNDMNVYAIDQDGSLVWKIPTKYPAYACPAVGDMDGDGLMEIVLGEGAHYPQGGLDIFVVNGEDGSLIWNFTSRTNSEEGFKGSPILHDIDDDGALDILIGSMDNYFYAFDGPTGNIIWRSEPFRHYIRTSPPMADIDNDGDLEIVGLDETALMRVFDVRTGRVKWSKELEGYGVGATQVIGDLDGDGYGEIVAFTILDGEAIVLNHDGTQLWNNTAYDYFYHTPTLVDVDGDGLLDVIGGASRNHTIVAYRGTDGAILWETTLPGITWSQAPLVSGDVDGDGNIEILAQGSDDLHSIDAKTGKIEWTFHQSKMYSQPTLFDVDGDGVAEIVVGYLGTIAVLEQKAPPRYEPRTQGYWKHQCDVKEPHGDHTGITQQLVDDISSQSKVFGSLQSPSDVCEVLKSNPKSDMREKARKQLLALWLNIVSGFVDKDATVDLPRLTNATTVGGALAEIESIVLSSYDKEELERAKDIADSINNGK